MARDSVLVWILILLVGISLFLSYTIWSGIPGEMTAESRVQEDRKVDLVSVISPDRILVHLGNSSHTLVNQSSPFYDRVWNFTRKTLVNQWSTASPEPVDLNADYFAQKRGMEVFFPAPLPAAFLKQVFNVKAQEVPFFDNKPVGSYLLVEDGGLTIYFRDADGRYYRLNKSADTGEMLQVLKDIADSNPPLYAALPPGNINLKVSKGIYVPLSLSELPIFTLRNEKIAGDRLAAKFFPDFSVTRKIEERDGAIIYTDGQRGLRIYPEGAVEYTYPGTKEQRKNSSFYEALNMAVEFINTHGGWPHGTYLSSYKTSGGGEGGQSYTFNFQIRVNGYPLIAEKDYLMVTVDGGLVKNYYRRIRIVDRQVKIQDLISPVRALDAAVVKQNIKTIDNLYPAYLAGEEELRAVWVINAPEKQVIIEGLVPKEIQMGQEPENSSE